jgi:predicted Zn-dependent protease
MEAYMQTSRNGFSWYRSVMQSGGLLLCAIVLFACQTVPVTGRQQLVLLSAEEETRMGLSAYEQILKEEKLSQEPQVNAMVKRVGQRIAEVANRPDFQWEFRVIEKDVANAFALPGGKVAVYTGILKYTQTEAGLAVVMGHEVAHALARHGGERMSRSVLAQAGLTLGQVALGGSHPGVMQAVNLAYGVGIELPFGRGQESEADHIGLILMAKAGYDPNESVPFWQRMSSGQTGNAPPEFLSTHPSGATRIEQLQQWMPEALQHYSPGRQ